MPELRTACSSLRLTSADLRQLRAPPNEALSRAGYDLPPAYFDGVESPPDADPAQNQARASNLIQGRCCWGKRRRRARRSARKRARRRVSLGFS